MKQPTHLIVQVMNPLRNLPKDVRAHIYSFLVIPIEREELVHMKQYHKTRTALYMIELCREMGFMHSLRGQNTGEYAHPSKLHFFWIKPRHLKKTYLVARTPDSVCCTSLLSRRCRICMDLNCNVHQKHDKNVETYLMNVIYSSFIENIQHRDLYTNIQYMSVGATPVDVEC